MSSRIERLARLGEVYLFGPDGLPVSDRPFEVESVWEHRGRVIFKFRGTDTISDAEHLRGAEIRIPRAQRFQLPEGEYYHDDLIGCEVTDADSGCPLGRVASWQESGGSGLLEVRTADGDEMLVPFARSICVGIDVERRQITVRLPEGLKELNR